MQEVAYVNGEFMKLGDAKVSIEDHGFLLADGVYEVFVAVNNRPFLLQEHLNRLKRSTDAIRLPVDYDALGLTAMVEEGIRRCGFGDVLVYLQITRGVQAHDVWFAFAPHDQREAQRARPTVVATFKPKPVYDAEVRERGIALETARDIRAANCSAKSTGLLPNVLLVNAAVRRGFFDALLVAEDGRVLETTCANVFMVSRDVLRTPPTTDRILPGVTRAHLLKCADRLGIARVEQDFTVPDLLAADEAFISSAIRDIIPVASVDGHTIGSARPGPTTSRLLRLLIEDMKAH